MYWLRIVYRYLMQLWFEPLKLFEGFRALFWFLPDYFKFKKVKNKDFHLMCSFPCLHDKYDNSWVCKWHYFHQDLIVAQEIFKENPKKHVDIASRVDWFVAHIATFREIEVLDIRKLDSKVKNIKFKQADLMNIWDDMKDYTSSISCLHAIEHFWLWRYWDSIDINWHIKGLDNIYMMLKKWGILYLSTPIWKQRIEFNAHRVFSVKYLYDYLIDKYEIEKFAYVDDNWDLHENVDIKWWFKNSFWCRFWCWLFKLRKI
jgi:hypothetical protein